MNLRLRIACLFIGCILPFSAAAQAQDEEGRKVILPEADRAISFNKDVLPVLQKNCLACHNKSETEGELIMESTETLLEGGDSGPAIVAGNADESLLFQLASHRTEPIMPPVDNDVGAKPLSANALGIIKRWIDQGAKADDDTEVEQIQWKKVPASYAQIFALEMSPDGRWLAAGRGNELVIYSVVGKREVHRLVDPAISETHPDSAHLDVVQSLAWSPDQHTIVSGGYRCIKVWRQGIPSINHSEPTDEDQTLLGDSLGTPLSFVVNDDKKRAVVLLKSDSGNVAKLVELPTRKVLKEIRADVFSGATAATAQRRVGLADERLRIAQSDVAVAKKRKEDDEKNTKKNEEELKKAEMEVPKKQEIWKKAEEANTQKQTEFDMQQKVVESKKKELAEASETDKKAKQDALQQAEEQLKQRKKELDNTIKEEKKKRQEFEGSEKVVKLAMEAIERAKKAVALRTTELAAAEKSASHYDQQAKATKKQAEKSRAEAKENESELESVVSLADKWQFGVQDQAGNLACFDFETGELTDVHAKTDNGEEESEGGQWQINRTIGSANSSKDSVFADRVTTLAYSHDGATLATGGGEPSRTGEVLLWSTHDWSMLGKLEDVHSDVVYDLQFSPQDNTLASCGSDRMMKTIDPSTAKAIRNFEGHTSHVLAVSWRADGRTLATAGADKVVKVWDAKEGTQKKTVSGFKSEVTSLRFLGLNDRFVFSTGSGKIESRDSGGNGKPGFAGFSDYVHKVSCSLDGNTVAAAGQDQVIRVWDSAGKLLVEFK